MQKPQHEVTAGIHKLTWTDFPISIRIDRLREDSRSVITGEVLVKTTAPGVAQHLHQARLNLTSTASRSGLARFLEKRLGLPDWDGVVEQACVMVIGEYRRGVPPVRLADVPVRERLQYRLKPFLVDRQANVLFGAGQTGKSMMASYLAILIDTTTEDNGFVPEPGKVLYVDYETDEEEIAQRIRCLQEGVGIQQPTGIIYRYGKMPLADDIEQVQRIVAEEDIEMVIVDSLGMAAGGDQDKSQDIIRYFQALRTLQCTSLTIDHVNKEGKQYGNVYKFNEARNIWEVRASSDPGTDSLSIGLYHRKMNNGRLEAPIGLRFDFAPRVFTVSKQSVMVIPELESAAPLRLRLRAILSQGAMAVSQLSEELQSPEDSIRRTLNRYKDLFQPVYLDGGREAHWGLKFAA